MTMRPDPTFYASPKLAMEAPPETIAYTLLLSPDFSKPDALAVVDVKPGSPTFSKVVDTLTMPYTGDEFHHFGWNACSSSLSPLTGHAFLERRYLIIPGLRSSRIYIVDTKPDPTKPKIHKIIEPEEVFKKTGYSRPHTVHCGPEGIYISTLGGSGKDGTSGPPGVFIMDCESFEVLGRWEIDRGPQTLHYDFWWNLPRDYMVTSEWALPPQFENGIVPEDLLSNKYGHRIHFSAPITRWPWRCGPRTTRFANTDFSASWSTPPTSRVRSGPGGATAASSTSRRPRPSRRSPPPRMISRRCCRALARCHRW
jgi:methanethiol oxidase